MVRQWQYQLQKLFFTVLLLHYVAPQTTVTDVPTSATTSNFPEGTTNSLGITTTFIPTITPSLTTEETTLATADSATQTTSLSPEDVTAEATTAGQATNEASRGAGRGRGFRFESQRNRPNANQEAAPEQETQTMKPEEKKIAWKFGRGGNNPGSWAPRPEPNSGYPFWKKQAGSSSAGDSTQSTESPGQNKPSDQAYIVWSVGQGNQANGWTLGGNSGPWAPAGASVPAGGWSEPAANSGAPAPQPGNWNTGGWVQDQSSNGGDSQSVWVDEQAPEEDSGPQEGWDDSSQGSWDSQNGNGGGWINRPPPGTPPNVQQANRWQAQNNAEGAWNPGTGQSDDEGGEWDSAPPSGGWAPDDSQDGTNDGDWSGNPGFQNDNSWNDDAPGNGGWNNEHPQSSDWNDGGDGSAGVQGGEVAWKVYNEDTQTMENIDENSGWKVVGDGGPGGWKLIDANGKIEWKIENVNGEWRVTSADDLSKTNDTSTSPETTTVNTTTKADNETSTDASTTAAPTGGWDDNKQGRYIIWKFSDDGKGEAKVYGGGGAEPAVWTVGDNNQWWKEAVGVKEANPVVQGGSNGNSWQGNNAWQNTRQQGGRGWNSSGKNGSPALVPPQSTRWQTNENTPKVPNPSPQSGNTKWQNRPAPQSNRWRGRNRNRNRWQQKSNGAPSPAQAGNTWQNPSPPSSGWNGGQPASNGWRKGRTNPQPNTVKQSAWKNRGSQTSGSWSNGGPRANNRWVSKNGSGDRKSGPSSGRVWNNRNSWNTGTNTQNKRNRGWTKNQPGTPTNPPKNAPPVYQNPGNKAGQGGRWSGDSGGGQTVPYIIIIKSPESATSGPATSSWRSDGTGRPAYKRPRNNNKGVKPQNNRRNNGWKMNKAGSSGWQWNPQGNGGWQWRDGWMGSGGGFGGWMGDKGAMYSNWRPTRTNGAQSRKNTQRGSGKDSKKSGSKMVFVFGTKRNTSNSRVQPGYEENKKGKQVIILDYTTGAKKIPNGEDEMKKDIESVIQALKVAKPSGVRRTVVYKQAKTTSQPIISGTSQWS